MTQTDLDALKLPIEAQRRRGAAHRTQIDNKLAREPWRDVAEFATYSCQVDALQLKPWEWPPIWVDHIGAALSEPEDAKRIRSAALLLQRMQWLNVSRFDPDPVGASAELGVNPGRVKNCNG
jgi:hypothetical protein